MEINKIIIMKINTPVPAWLRRWCVILIAKPAKRRNMINIELTLRCPAKFRNRGMIAIVIDDRIT
jgi:hypothetical protein